MGLCKCPKRKVTNLFCFEHDVNVCEYCLVANHERCIVQSYVQWLQDSDYNPICILCKRLLSEEPTVRLICYDVFHWSCLNKYASSLPSTTAPAGYQCPKCKECIFPPSNLVSPVVDSLKSKLKQVSWAKIGLNQTLIDETPKTEQQTTNKSQVQAEDDYVIVSNKQQQSTIDQQLTASKILSRSTDYPFVHGLTNKVKTDAYRAYNPIVNDNIPQSHSRTTNNQSERSTSPPLVLNLNNDSDENKYKRRSIFDWLSRLLKSHQTNGGNSRGNSSRIKKSINTKKRCFYLTLLIFICFITIIFLFARLSSIRSSDDNDPFLDPMNNPNIHVE